MPSLRKVFCDHTDTLYYDLRRDEKAIDLALKVSMKGMSIEAIADVLEVQSDRAPDLSLQYHIVNLLERVLKLNLVLQSG